MTERNKIIRHFRSMGFNKQMAKSAADGAIEGRKRLQPFVDWLLRDVSKEMGRPRP